MTQVNTGYRALPIIAAFAMLAASAMAADEEAALSAIPIFPAAAPTDFYPSGKGRILFVDNRNQRAADTNAGTDEAPFRTIDAAARAAGPGDEIRVRPGVYRERIALRAGGTFERPIRFVATPPGEVVVKGSDTWQPEWRRLPGAGEAWAADIPPALFEGGRNPFLRGISIAPKENRAPARPVAQSDRVWPLTLGQLFVAGEPYRQVEQPDLVRRFPATWIVDGDGRSLIAHFRAGQQPADAPLIEISVRDRIFAPHRRGLGFIQIKGFVFEHCANQGPFPQGGAVSTRSGHHWRIEDNVIRFAQTIGLDCGSEYWDAAALDDTEPADRRPSPFPAGYHLIAGNTITDNGLCGLAGWHHRQTQVLRNVVERNNRLDFDTSRAQWEEWAGIKFHDCDGALIADNLVRDNEGFGIWLDNRWHGARITRNVVINNRMAGIFFELGTGPALADNNIVAGTRSRGIFCDGIGIYTHDAAGVTVAHNLILGNAGCGVAMRTVTGRLFAGQPVHTSDALIVNNVIAENGGPAVNLPFTNALARHNVSDANVLSGAKEYRQGLNNWPALMAVNRFTSSASDAAIVQSLREALPRAGIPESDWPNLKHWSKNPVLSLAQWRALTGNDCRSVESAQSLVCHLAPLLLTLDLKAGDDLWRVVCEPVAGVDADFFGQPIPAARPLPGPFQGLTHGTNAFVLWPPAIAEGLPQRR